MTQIPTKREYIRSEFKMLTKQLVDVECMPLSDRIDAFKDATMNFDANIIIERLSWLFNGSYGYGACHRAYRIVDHCKNPNPALWRLLLALEWQLSERYATMLWQGLDKATQDDLNARFTATIVNALEEPTIRAEELAL